MRLDVRNWNTTQSRLSLSVLVLCALVAACQTQPNDQRQTFAELQRRGIEFTEKTRLSVADILVGGKSVRGLFDITEQKAPSWTDGNPTAEYYWGRHKSVNLRLRSPEAFEHLRFAVGVGEPQQVTVILRDDTATILRRLFPSRFSGTRVIEFSAHACDRISTIVYRSIDSQIRSQIELSGQTSREVHLNQLFDLLLRNEIEPFMATLTPVERADACFETFDLLKWLRGEVTAGFEFEKYRLHDGLKALFEPVIQAILTTQDAWQKHHLSIAVAGFTDPIGFDDPIALREADSGLTSMPTMMNLLNVKYTGCRRDNLIGPRSVFVRTASRGGESVGAEIDDNCELGAIRAYVATAYLVSRLPQSNIEYSYATGGVSRDPRDTDSDDSKRRVSVAIRLVAARSQ